MKATLSQILFPIRVQRLSYLLRMLACMVPCVLIGLLIGLLGTFYPPAVQSPILRPLVILFAIAWYGYLLLFVVAPRFHDLGLPRICILMAFFPGLNLILGLMALFAPTGWWLKFKAGK